MNFTVVEMQAAKWKHPLQLTASWNINSSAKPGTGRQNWSEDHEILLRLNLVPKRLVRGFECLSLCIYGIRELGSATYGEPQISSGPVWTGELAQLSWSYEFPSNCVWWQDEGRNCRSRDFTLPRRTNRSRTESRKENFLLSVTAVLISDLPPPFTCQVSMQAKLELNPNFPYSRQSALQATMKKKELNFPTQKFSIERKSFLLSAAVKTLVIH